ncbi:response regulator [Rhodoferax sp.]|uniref:response regulator n=1 Tax=Rhodoferax sp. TaxID=50421 RepID=UPI001EB7E943|nr:response regulator [Rhodoferax sp.]MBT9505120.1 response regulator [Rhodoferax sp.]
MNSLIHKPRVLVVENEAIVALDIRLQLVELGYEPVGQTMRGGRAVHLAGQLRPDLVLMDIKLADSIDGVAAAQAIQTLYAIPVVFLSAFSEHEVMARARLVKPYGYIVKPFSQWEMRTVMEIALYKRKEELDTCCCGLHSNSHHTAEDCFPPLTDDLGLPALTERPQGSIDH